MTQRDGGVLRTEPKQTARDPVVTAEGRDTGTHPKLEWVKERAHSKLEWMKAGTQGHIPNWDGLFALTDLNFLGRLSLFSIFFSFWLCKKNECETLGSILSKSK